MKKDNLSEAAILRQKAEEILKKNSSKSASRLSEAEAMKLIHELEVHQIVLEMQNAELELAGLAAQVAADKYIELYDFAPLGYFTLSKEGEIIDLNLFGSQMLGKERSGLKNKLFGSLISADTKPVFYHFLKRVFDNNSKETCEVTLSINSNFSRYVHLIGNATKDGEQCIVNVVDVTEQKQAEEALKNSLALMDATLESFHNGILIVSNQGTVIKTNAKFADMWQIPGDILTSGEDKLLLNCILGQLADSDKFIAKIKELYSKPEAESFDLINFKDGRIFERISKPMYHEGKPKGRVWSFLDITERKQVEEELRESESSLRNAQEIAKMGSWVWDLITQKAYWSDNYFTIIGFKPAEVRPSFELFRNRIHPEDVRFLDETHATIMKDKTPFSFELRLIQTDGTVKWIQNNISPVIENDKIVKLKGVIIDITDRKQAEKALLESEAEYKVLSKQLEAILDHIPGLVFYKDMKNNYIRVNKYVAEAHGKVKEELEGKNLSDLYPEKDATNYYQDDLAVINSGVAKLNIDEPWETASGLKWVSTSKIPFVGDNGEYIGIIGMSMDITERKRVEEELVREQYLMRTLMDNLPDHIYFKDLESKFVRINKSHSLLFGLDNPEQAIGKTDFDFFSGEHSQQAFEDEQEIIRTGQPLSIEEKETYHDDRPDTWVSTVKMPLYNKERKIIGTFGISRDVTKQQSVQQEIKFKNEELHKLNAEKDKFFSIIAHDLRGPFSGFLGLTQIMAEQLSNLTKTQIQDLSVSMKDSATNLYRLLENLLQWAKMQQGLIHLDLKEIQLHPVVDESITMVQNIAKNKGIEITSDIPDDIMVYADSNILQTIIRNLVSNAVKFTSKGGKISISAKASGDKSIEISAKDSGIGMNPEMVNNLFQLNAQINRKGTEGEPSSGLGLLLCKEFIEKHGGKFWVESEEGKGSTFYFTLA